MKFSEKFGKMESNILLDLDEAKRKLEAQGREVINLSIGTPDFPPDKHVMNAVSKAFQDPKNYVYGMTESDELIEAVSNWYKRRYGVDVSRENICCLLYTSGSIPNQKDGEAVFCCPDVDTINVFKIEVVEE